MRTIISVVRKTHLYILIFLGLLVPLHPSTALPIFSASPAKCRLADFKTVIFFFLANYASHAFTVPSAPGDVWRWSLFMKIGCIFYPFAGLIRSGALLFNHWHQRGKGSIGDAIAQGAVMVAVRSPDWRPAEYWERIFVGLPEDFKPPKDTGSLDELPTIRVNLEIIHHRTTSFMSGSLLGQPMKEKLDTTGLDIHGESQLPSGYHWTIPSIGELNALKFLERPENIKVARSRSWLKGLIALAQLVFSSITIYQARGDQLKRYGYAAFGLSVFPYTLMSLVNLIVTSIIGEYSHLCILRTEVSDEAKQRPGSTISGEVGTLGGVSKLVEKASGEVVEDAGEERDSAVGAAPGPEEEHPAPETLKSEEQKRQQEFMSGKRLFTSTRLRIEKRGTDTVLFVEANDTISCFLLVGQGKDALTLYVNASANTPKMEVHNDGPFYSNNPLAMAVVLTSSYAAYVLLGVFPYIFIFLLTKFSKGHSTHAERGWMMSWLVFDQLFAQVGLDFTERSAIGISWYGVGMVYACTLISAIPAIGGFIMVGKMLLEFTPCAISE